MAFVNPLIPYPGRKIFGRHRFRLLLQLRELVWLERTFQKADIPVIHLKGLVQEFMLTGRLPQRRVVDLDILISDRKRRRTVEALQSLGYQFIRTPQSRPITKVPPTQCHFLKHVAGEPIVVELHTWPWSRTVKLLPIFPLFVSRRIVSEFFARRETIEWQSVRFGVLNQEDLMIYLCLHFLFHHLCRGRDRLNDMVKLAATKKIDWQTVLKRTDKWKIGEFVYLPLLMVNSGSNFPVPTETLARLKPSRFREFMVRLVINPKNLIQPISRTGKFLAVVWLWLVLGKQPYRIKLINLFTLKFIRYCVNLANFPNHNKHRE